MKNLFTKSQLDRHKTERPIVRNVTANFLEEKLAGASKESWMNEPVGNGLQNTQQLKVDWSDFAKHVFFNSAEAKVNLAFDQIVNGYPFDGTAEEKSVWRSTIGGYTKYLYDQMPSHFGYLNFSGNTASFDPSSTLYLSVKDHTGYLAPDLAKVVGKAKATSLMNTKGSTVEFWMYVDSSARVANANQYAVIYQKADEPDGSSETKKAFTVIQTQSTQNPDNANKWEYSVHFMIGSDEWKSIPHKLTNLEEDRWYHICFTYERSNTERVLAYRDGRYISKTEVDQAELDDITTAKGSIRIGYSPVRHVGFGQSNVGGYDMSAATANTSIPYRGLLDELRVWLGPRSSQDILRYYQRNVDSQDTLLVYYRFNEPKSDTSNDGHSYGAKEIILDYSGNSLHNQILNYVDAIRNQHGSIDSPVSLEKASDNKILFPDWVPNQTLNATLVKSGNHYDRNNPNLITKLVPRHYFEEAKFFEGIEKDWEEPEAYGQNPVPTDPIPGHGKIPTRVVLMSFLLTWANFFDDIKLFLDHFVYLDKVSYDNYDQIPPQLIMFLSDYYGINLPDPYINETPDRYKEGENVENSAGIATPLKNTIDSMWRRVLINLPFLLRSRGTVQGVRALLNSIGIESDGIFKFREFGGNISTKITSSRRKRKKRSLILDFSNLVHVESKPLWAYRHEGGQPDPDAGPTNSNVTFQSGDIVTSQPAGPPVETQYMSGSWTWEGRYQLDPTEDVCSLFRIERDGEILLNLIADRSEETSTGAYNYNLNLFVDGHKNTTDQKVVNINGLNLWDSNPWYIQVYHEWKASNPTVGIRVLKTSDKYIVENHTKEVSITKETLAPTVTDNAPFYYYDATASDTLKYFVGTKPGITYSGTRNVPSGFATQGYHSRDTNYSGYLSHMRLWTKKLDLDTSYEHARNPFSMAISDPINSFAFMQAPIKQINSSGMPEWVPLEKYSTKYPEQLPYNSWERLRHSYDMLQGETTFVTGSLHLWDTSQNENNLTLSGSAGGLTNHELIYTMASTDFDFNSTSNKVRVRSFQDKETARENFVHHGKLTVLPREVGIDDRRFSIESSLVHALNEDMLNITGDSDIFNDYLGAPELEYAVQYPELAKLRDVYFERIQGRVNYNSIIEFQRWFNDNFASLIEQFIPHTADFLGINFVIESHLLERHKFEYKQGDVHVDIYDRVAFSQEPLFISSVTSEIT